jgi:hypothetical protein
LHVNGFRIVVLDRGWVFVGQVVVDGDMLTISDAQCIRRWGSTKGLGQLAAEGPTKETKLDPSGLVRAPLRAVILTLDTEPQRWSR